MITLLAALTLLCGCYELVQPIHAPPSQIQVVVPEGLPRAEPLISLKSQSGGVGGNSYFATMRGGWKAEVHVPPGLYWPRLVRSEPVIGWSPIRLDIRYRWPTPVELRAGRVAELVLPLRRLALHLSLGGQPLPPEHPVQIRQLHGVDDVVEHVFSEGVEDAGLWALDGPSMLVVQPQGRVGAFLSTWHFWEGESAGPIALELGEHVVEFSCRRAEEPVPGVRLEMHRPGEEELAVDWSDAGGVARFYMNSGTYIVEIKLIDLVVSINVDASTEWQVTIP